MPIFRVYNYLNKSKKQTNQDLTKHLDNQNKRMNEHIGIFQ